MIQCPANSQPMQIQIITTPPVGAGSTKPISAKFYYLNAGPGVDSAAGFKAAFDAAIATIWGLALPATWPAPTIKVKDMSNYYNAETVFLPAVNAAYVGTIASDPLPQAACAYIEKRTSLGGKINRGSLHFSGIPESQTTAGELIAGYITLLTNLTNALTTLFVTGAGFTFVPQLFSPSLSNQRLGTVGIWMQPWINSIISSTVSGLKRMKQKNVYA
jgi:hypothetical protein